MEASKSLSTPGEGTLQPEISQTLSGTPSPSLGETLQLPPSLEATCREESMPNFGSAEADAAKGDQTAAGAIEMSRDRHFMTIVRNFTPS